MKKQSFLLALITLVVGFISVLFLPLTVDNEGLEFIRKHEAFAPCPYRDQGGVWTIGYGMTYYYDGSQVTGNDNCITKSEADFHLRRLLREYEWTVHDNVDVNLTQAQYNALVSFAYNVGSTRFENSRLLRVINNNPTDPQIVNEFMRWIYVKNRKTGKYFVSRGLRYRREKEIELYFSQPYLFPEREPVVSYFKPDTVLIP